MEREWRLIERPPFSRADVARVILPKSYQDRFIRHFPDLKLKTHIV